MNSGSKPDPVPVFVSALGHEIPLADMTAEQVALAGQILDEIARDPDGFSQVSWVRYGPNCNTSRCVAGWAVSTAQPDATFRFDDAGLDLEPTDPLYEAEDAANHLADGRFIPKAAADLLGLSQAQSLWLFYKADEADAVEYLRRSVDWSKARESSGESRSGVEPEGEGTR